MTPSGECGVEAVAGEEEPWGQYWASAGPTELQQNPSHFGHLCLSADDETNDQTDHVSHVKLAPVSSLAWTSGVCLNPAFPHIGARLVLPAVTQGQVPAVGSSCWEPSARGQEAAL